MNRVAVFRPALRLGAFIAAASVMPVLAEPDMGKYGRSCAMCHASGAAGEPKTGDAKAWGPRIAKGMDVLMESVKKGLNAMQPTGLCSDCSDEDYRELISYMASSES